VATKVALNRCSRACVSPDLNYFLGGTMNFTSVSTIGVSTFFALAMLGGCNSGVPSTYETWSTEGGSIEIDYPASWKESGSWQRDETTRAIFKDGDVSVRVIGALLEDGATIDPRAAEFNSGHEDENNGSDEEAEDIEAVEQKMTLEKFDEQNLLFFTKSYPQYQQTSTENMDLPIGPAIVSEFTANVENEDVQGVRAVLFDNGRSLTFRARAPKGQWKKLKPVFMKMLKSAKYVEPSNRPLSPRTR